MCEAAPFSQIAPAQSAQLPAVRSLGYQTDLAVLRHQGAELTARDGYLAVRTPGNPDFWWGNFLLLPELDSHTPAHEWLARFAAEFPEARHVALGLDTPAAPPPLQLAEWTALGFQLERSTVLTATRTAPRRPLPPGTVLRPLHLADDWHQALNLRLAVNAAEEAPIPDYLPFARSRLRLLREAQERGAGAVWGAFVNGQLRAALGIYRAGEYEGGAAARYQSVETHPDWRSQGLAGGLVHAAGEWARQQLGAQTLVIVADPEYHAQALYQSLGFSVREDAWGLVRPPDFSSAH
ncbi:GNAT family N-acetyltransferase [Deinococcus sp. Marseille-Q6407]|uniref:GNAT family N-acetyltransferase n=1 Tax=Deinococcus sp. Marseille-Q6407 TaxID=2969223 RepID=UPI0021C0BA3E|nr:GNAT family N-acetyltransferase [Deinococcus sp. Marseille-Q6407]